MKNQETGNDESSLKETASDVTTEAIEQNPVTRAESAENEVEHLRRISRFLDNKYKIPKTRYRFGVDALAGFIPGIGDVLTSVFSIYILYKAYLLGIPYSTIARMGINIILDTVIGILPLVGDIFDVGYKSNEKNVDLIEARGEEAVPQKRDKLFAIAFVAIPILAVVVAIVLVIGSVVSLI